MRRGDRAARAAANEAKWLLHVWPSRDAFDFSSYLARSGLTVSEDRRVETVEKRVDEPLGRLAVNIVLRRVAAERVVEGERRVLVAAHHHGGLASLDDATVLAELAEQRSDPHGHAHRFATHRAGLCVLTNRRTHRYQEIETSPWWAARATEQTKKAKAAFLRELNDEMMNHQKHEVIRTSHRR